MTHELIATAYYLVRATERGKPRRFVILAIEEAEQAIAALKRTSKSDRTAFAALVLLKNRR